jgi:DNA-binding transcriptional LysR family regulator
MDLMSLRYFQEVAAQRNFSRAAELFFLSQSTLSRQIANLETELGVKLLKRDTRSVRLTSAGAVLYDQCPALLGHFDTVIARLEAAKHGTSETLTVATVSEFAATLKDLACQFRERYPDVKLIVNDLSFAELTGAVVNGTYDIGLTLDFMVPATDEVEAIAIGQDSLVAVRRPESEPPWHPMIELRQLLGGTVAVPAVGAPTLISRLKLAARQPGAPETVFIKCHNTRSAMLQVLFSDAITVMPRLTIETAVAAGEFAYAEIDDPSAKTSLCLLVRKDRETAAAKNFVTMAKVQRPRSHG